MNKLNIVGKNVKAGSKIIKLEMFNYPDDGPHNLYTITDGKGNYTLSGDNSIWYTDDRGKSDLMDSDIHGNPNKLYKGKPQLFVVKVNGKLGVWDLAILKQVSGPYKDMDELIEDIYREESLGKNLKYLTEFDPQIDDEPDYDIW